MGFKISVDSNHRQPISRLSEEGLAISSSVRRKEEGEELILMYNKTQFYQPGVVHGTFTREFSSPLGVP